MEALVARVCEFFQDFLFYIQCHARAGPTTLHPASTRPMTAIELGPA